MITPYSAFVRWFDSLPLDMKKHLAHVFRVCTVDDMTMMIVSPEESLLNFKTWLLKEDFILRLVARLYQVRSVFDMIMIHRNLILKNSKVFGSLSSCENLIDFSSAQWNRVFVSWKNLRSKYLSDTYMNFWASSIIGKQMEGSNL